MWLSLKRSDLPHSFLYTILCKWIYDRSRHVRHQIPFHPPPADRIKHLSLIRHAAMILAAAFILFYFLIITSSKAYAAGEWYDDNYSVTISSSAPLVSWRQVGLQNTNGTIEDSAKGSWSYNASGNYIVNDANQNGFSGFMCPGVNFDYIDLYMDIGSWNQDDDCIGCFVNTKQYGINNFDSYIFLLCGPPGTPLESWNPGTGTNSGLYKVKNAPLGHGYTSPGTRVCMPNSGGGLKWQRGVYKQLRVLADKNRIRVWYDGKLEIDYTDPADNAITDGSFGFFSISQEDARFKDIRYNAKLARYNVDFVPNGERGKIVLPNGTESSETVQQYGISTRAWSPNIQGASAKRPGYVFKGWNTKPDGSGTAYSSAWFASHTVALSSDLVLYAQWERGNWAIDYDANGGKDMPADALPDGTVIPAGMQRQSIPFDTEYSLSSVRFKKVGYDFVEWNTEADGSGRAFSDGETLSENLGEDIGNVVTLYAQWERHSYTVTVSYIVGGANGGGALRAPESFQCIYEDAFSIDGLNIDTSHYISEVRIFDTQGNRLPMDGFEYVADESLSCSSQPASDLVVEFEYLPYLSVPQSGSVALITFSVGIVGTSLAAAVATSASARRVIGRGKRQ